MPRDRGQPDKHALVVLVRQQREPRDRALPAVLVAVEQLDRDALPFLAATALVRRRAVRWGREQRPAKIRGRPAAM